MTTEAKTYDTKFNAQRGAQRTGLKPSEIEVFKTPNGRFGWRRLAAKPTKALAPVAAAPTDDAYEPPPAKPAVRRLERFELAGLQPGALRTASGVELRVVGLGLRSHDQAPSVWVQFEGTSAERPSAVTP